jgi:hypothetical protein
MHTDEFKETLPRVQDDGELLWKNGSALWDCSHAIRANGRTYAYGLW